MKIKVAFREIALAEQLLDRQSTHATAVGSYLDSNCSIQGDLGYVLAPLSPAVTFTVGLGTTAAEAVGKIASLQADAAARTLDKFVASERENHDEFNALQRSHGKSTTPFNDPRDDPPTLGNPTSAADADYGEGSDGFLGSIKGMIDSAADTASDAVELSEFEASPPSRVTERSDPESYLVSPDLGDDPIGDLRWSAGSILGSLDWVAEKFLGYSILEDKVMKPLAGDWETIKKSALAWQHSGKAWMEMSSNYSGLPLMITAWEGAASLAFSAAMDATAGALIKLSYGYDAIGDLVNTVGTVAKAAATAIGMILKQIAKKLARLAAEASIPVAGWIVGAFDAAKTIDAIITSVRLINTTINLIVDAIQGFIDGKAKFVQTLSIIEDMLEEVAQTAGGGRKAAAH